jgi:hypothetical protein
LNHVEKLSDKDHRERAWKIYLEDKPAKPGESNDKIPEGQTSSTSLKPSNDKNFNSVDREAVENIEKRIKIMNKVQSGYKQKEQKDNTAEVETVKEVYKSRSKFSSHNSQFDCGHFSKKSKKR